MKLPQNILDIIASNKTSLGDNPALPPELNEKFLVSVVGKYYDELLTHFDSIDVEELTRDLSKSLTDCKRFESSNKEALEKLCSDIVVELFNIPNDTVIMDMKLVSKVDTKQERLVPENSDNFSFDSIEDMNNLTSEIYKRRMLNVLIIGASMYYAENINAYSEELSHINSQLPSIYKKILCINDLLLFHTKQSLSKKETDGGKVDVYISSPDTPVRINAEGIMFPVLLEETIRGLLELSIAHGLPEERDRAEYITSKTDFKLAEIWDQRLGVPLWKRIVKVMDKIDEDPIEVGLNFIFMEISKLKPSNFNFVMKEVLAETKVGHQILKELSNKIHSNKEQDDFDNYMQQQYNDYQYPLNDDGEFTSDELINDDLCSNVVLDEEDY